MNEAEKVALVAVAMSASLSAGEAWVLVDGLDENLPLREATLEIERLAHGQHNYLP